MDASLPQSSPPPRLDQTWPNSLPHQQMPYAKYKPHARPHHPESYPLSPPYPIPLTTLHTPCVSLSLPKGSHCRRRTNLAHASAEPCETELTSTQLFSLVVLA